MKQKTIVIFSAYIYPHLGGIETYLDNLFRELHKTDYQIVVVTSNWNREIDFEKKDFYDVIRLPVCNAFKNRYPIFKLNRTFRQLMGLLNDYDVRSVIVNTRFHLSSHIGAGYAAKNRIPCFLIEHGSSFITLNNKTLDLLANLYERFLTFKIKGKITAFYGVSKRCNEWLEKLNIKANGVFYNAVDQSIFDRFKEYLTKENEKTIVTYAGRVLYEKGVGNLLEAFSSIQNENCELVIAGDGNALDELKRTYAKDDRIRFLGKIDHDEVIKLLAKTDIFCYPSMYPEGLPTSVLEAGLMKCAIIATDRGGTAEVINAEDLGLIVKENVEDLAEKLNFLVQNKNAVKQMKERLHVRIKENFVWSKTAQTVIREIKKYERT